MENYRNPDLSPSERAEDLLSRMTAAEKMAQLGGVMPFKDLPNMDERLATFLKNGIGQISTLDFRNRKTVSEAAEWQRHLQEAVMKSSRFGIPAVFHMEGLCGPLIRGGVSFPSGIGRGASFHPETERDIGAITARQELSCGITQILAPVLDISRDPRMGRYCEPYSEDGTLAAAMGTEYTKGIHSAEVDGRKAESAAKHFLGFHASQGGIHGTNSELGEPVLREQFGKPFQAAIREAGLRSVMPCYDSLNGMPVHASESILNGLLRDEMGFDGVIVSDYSGIENVHDVQKLCDSPEDAGYLCMCAGMDVDLPMPSAFNQTLADQFERGERDMAVLDRACRRVLEAKFRMGLFEHPFALEGEALDRNYLRESDREVSLRSAGESLVLLKNDGVLPLSGSVGKIALIGPHIDNAAFFFGGYTHVSMVEAARAAANSMAGTGGGGSTEQIEMKRIPGTHVQSDESPEFASILPWLKPGCPSLREELTVRLPETEILTAKGYEIFGRDESRFEEALNLIARADLVLLTLGGKNGSGSVATMGEGVDGTDINLPACQEAFIRRAKALGKPMVGIHLDGRPISSDAADECLNAILECWNPSEFGARAIVDALVGEINPSGKLPVTVARSASQLPVWYNHYNGSQWHQGPSIGFRDYVDMSHTPRYPFGHGLSYTEFEYSALIPDRKEIGPSEKVTVTVSVRNVGKVAGTEVVQLYLRDEHACRIRPVMELAGFARVTLKPGEVKTVSFALCASSLSFFLSPHRWLIEKGPFELCVGASSGDIRLRDTLLITESAVIDGRDRALWAESCVR